MASSDSGPKNIVIFGESGSGKSSLINLLTQSTNAEVSNEAVGCTFKYKSYAFGDFKLYDTAGLSEGAHGRVAATEAIKNLVLLVDSLSNRSGVNLLIYVIPRGRIKEMTQTNYKVFVHGICHSSVPVILFVTHCELDTSMESWWERNKQYFDNHEMKFSDVICGTAADTNGDNLVSSMREIISERKRETRNKLTESIERYCLKEPWEMPIIVFVLKAIMHEILNKFVYNDLVSLLPDLKQVFIRDCHMPPKKAKKLANSIAESIYLDNDRL